jgi:hypothetical protein
MGSQDEGGLNSARHGSDLDAQSNQSNVDGGELIASQSDAPSG